ncbi:MAG: hypothetical protein JWL84_5598 [Rhodospirillales bacterium]|nr:hypothetical protein [Rhodospirillales bacterium]
MAALSLPLSAPMSVFAGFLFGRGIGAAAAVSGATIGAGLVFALARTALGEAWRRRAGPWLRRFELGFRDNAFSYLLTLRILPIFPFWLINLVAAFLGIRLGVFLAATCLGIIPGAGFAAVLERGEEPDLAIVLTPQIFLPLLALAPAAYKLWRRGRSVRGGTMRGEAE